MRLSPSFVALAVGASSFSSAFASPVPADAVPNSPALSNTGTPSGTPSLDSGAFQPNGAAAQIDTTKLTNGNILQQTPQYHTDELTQRGLLSVSGSGSGSKPASGSNSGLGLGLIGLGGSSSGNPASTVSGATNKVGLLGVGGATSGNPASSVSGATNKVGLLGLTNSKASS